MSTDNAYVEADKVGVSTDVSGIVKEVDVADNQHVDAGPGPVPPRRSRSSGSRSSAPPRRSGSCVTIQCAEGGLPATCRAQIAQQAQDDIDYYDREFHRQQDLAAKNIASQQTIRSPRVAICERDNSKLASLNQQLAAISRKPQRRSRHRGRAASAIYAMPWRSARSRAPARPYGRQGAVRRHRDERARARAGQVPAASTTAFYLVAADHVWVDANPKETELTHVRARPAGHGDGRHLSGRGMAWHRREHQPGGGAGVLAAAGTEHQRQLGEGRAAHPDARAPRHQRQVAAAAARWNERRGQRRYRACARLAAIRYRARSAMRKAGTRDGRRAPQRWPAIGRRSPSA